MPISTIGSNSLNQTSDLTINGVTVGKGGGAVSSNTAVGASALAAVTSADAMTAVGYQAAAAATTGNRLTAVGYQSLASTTTGSESTAVGRLALKSNTTGGALVAIGHEALYSNTLASSNTAVGYQAGYSTTIGAESVYIGQAAGYSATVNGQNTFVGRFAGNPTTGQLNAFFGYGAGSAVISGTKNTIIGRYDGNYGGLDIRTASNYIVLSDGDGNPRQVIDSSGQYFIGCTAITSDRPNVAGGTAKQVNGNTKIRVDTDGVPAFQFYSPTGGTSPVGSIAVGSSTTSYNVTSDYRLKKDVAPMTGALAKIALLKPVTYKWKSNNSDGQGFIAHELQAVAPDCVTGEKDALATYIDENGNEATRPVYQGIDTSFLIATLTAAIQELKTIVDAQAAEIAELKTKVA